MTEQTFKQPLFTDEDRVESLHEAFASMNSAIADWQDLDPTDEMDLKALLMSMKDVLSAMPMFAAAATEIYHSGLRDGKEHESLAKAS